MLSPLQDRVVLLVQMKLDKLRLLDARIAACAAREGMDKAVREYVRQFTKTLFPGLEDKFDNDMQQAKEMLAREVKNVLLVKRKDHSLSAMKKAIHDPTGSPQARYEMGKSLDKIESGTRRLKARMSFMNSRSLGVDVEEL